jgi:hypothetical protein
LAQEGGTSVIEVIAGLAQPDAMDGQDPPSGKLWAPRGCPRDIKSAKKRKKHLGVLNKTLTGIMNVRFSVM